MESIPHFSSENSTVWSELSDRDEAVRQAKPYYASIYNHGKEYRDFLKIVIGI